MWTEVCLGDGKHSHTEHQTCDRKQLISRGTTAVCVRVCVFNGGIKASVSPHTDVVY